MPDHRDAAGNVMTADDPQRLVWYGVCGYWTDDWSRLVLRGPGVPCCPECGAPGMQTTAQRWHDSVNAYDADHPGYLAHVNRRRERCPKRGEGT